MKKTLLIFALSSLLTSTSAWAAAGGEQQKHSEEKPPEEAKADEKKPEEKKADDSTPAKPDAKPANENLTGSVEVGYRFVGNGGSLETYRTLVNLGQGPRLLHADFRYVSPTHKWFDTITGFASGWGDPYNMAKLSVYKEAAYSLDFDYRNLLYYSFLPSYANPQVASGVLLPQSAFDQNRRSFDGELKIRPKSHISPFLAFSRDWGAGTGITDFVNNSTNEYPVFTALNDKTDRFRAGARIEYSNFHVTVEEGGTTFKDDENASTNNPNSGDRSPSGAYLLDTLNQAYRIRGSSVFTQVLASWTPVSWASLSGQFLYSRPKIDTTVNELATGVFNVPGSLQYVSLYQDSLLSNANQPHSTGLYTIDLHPWKNFRILDSLLLDRFHTAAVAMAADLTPLPSPAAYSSLLNYNYNRHQTEVMDDITPWLTLRAGFRNVWGDASVPGNQVSGLATETGSLSQNVLLLGFQIRAFQKLFLNTDFEKGFASQAYFRTSLYNYTKASMRARYQLTAKWNLAWNSLWLTNENPASGINLDFKSTQNGISTMFVASKTFQFLGDYYYSTLRSNISYLIPQLLSPAVSAYRDTAHTASALVEVNKFGAKLTFGGSMFKSAGSRPTAYYQPQARLQMPVNKHVSVFGDWRYYGYNETFYLYESFRSNQFTAGLRMWR